MCVKKNCETRQSCLERGSDETEGVFPIFTCSLVVWKHHKPLPKNNNNQINHLCKLDEYSNIKRYFILHYIYLLFVDSLYYFYFCLHGGRRTTYFKKLSHLSFIKDFLFWHAEVDTSTEYPAGFILVNFVNRWVFMVIPIYSKRFVNIDP